MRPGWTVDTELVSYVTIEGVVHGVVWQDRNDGRAARVVLICTEQPFGTGERTAANPEPITCTACHAKGWSHGN